MKSAGPFVVKAHLFTIVGAYRATDSPTITEMALICTCVATLEFSNQNVLRIIIMFLIFPICNKVHHF